MVEGRGDAIMEEFGVIFIQLWVQRSVRERWNTERRRETDLKLVQPVFDLLLQPILRHTGSRVVLVRS
jgi:hypothetical protein